jgi:hypothetical protein
MLMSVKCLDGQTTVTLRFYGGRMQGAKYDWFGRGRAHDARYLDEWRDVPLSYRLGQPVDTSFHRDHHEQVITENCTPAIFTRAADLLLRYQFYGSSALCAEAGADISTHPITIKP